VEEKPEVVALLRQLRDVEDAKRHDEEKLSEVQQNLVRKLAELGVGEVFMPNLGKFSYRQNRSSSVVDWEGVAKEAGATPEQVAKYMTERPGAWVPRSRWERESGVNTVT
jgi:hypothetical protein